MSRPPSNQPQNRNKPAPTVSLPGANKRPAPAAGAYNAKPQQTTAPAAAAASVDLLSLIGAQISLTYAASPSSTETIAASGLLYCYDAGMGCVALQEISNEASTSKHNYRIVRSNLIRSVAITAPSSDRNFGTITSVDLNRVKHNEKDAVEKDRTRTARLEKGVSKLGQEIFDALSKTLPVEWLETSMLVLDDIIIDAPYTPAQCRSREAQNTAKQQTLTSSRLERVQKVLQGERERILKLMPELGT